MSLASGVQLGPYEVLSLVASGGMGEVYRALRLLTRLDNVAAMRTFDITPDGKQIVFDRLLENSDIVLIDLPERP